jgi:hypothetical protein
MQKQQFALTLNQQTGQGENHSQMIGATGNQSQILSD